MDISVFLTQKAAQGAGKSPAATQAALSGSGIFSGVAGANFMDLIFARLTADSRKTENTETPPAQGTPVSKKSVPQQEQTAEIALMSVPGTQVGNDPLPPAPGLQTTDLSTDGLAESTPAEGATDETLSLEAAPDLTTPAVSAGEKPALLPDIIRGSRKFSALLENLLRGIPEGEQPAIFELNPGKIKNLLAQARGEKDIPTPALIAAGLTPEQLTALLKDVADGNEQGEAFVIGLVKIMPPESKKEAIFLPRGIVITPPQNAAAENIASQTTATPEGEEIIAAKMNALAVGDETPLPEENDFEDILRILERAQENGVRTGQQNGTNGLENAIGKIRQHAAGNMPGAGLSSAAATLPGTAPLPSEILTDVSINGIFPEGWDFATGSAHSLNITGSAQLTSMVSHIQQAGMPHPATQMVASVIAKNAAGGESRNITIQLDPPDLGKVSVRMEFHKDGNTMKAVLIAEKPETYLMLQRDAHVLERALQDSGVNADGGLSFELSQDGSAFSHDHHSTGGNSGGGNGAEGGSDTGADMEITETRMDWYVDPQTGRTRYDALI